MSSSNLQTNSEESSKRRPARCRKLYWVGIAAAAGLVLFILLLLHEPAGFETAGPVDNNCLSPYLTNELMPQLYNGAQSGEPFEVIVSDKGINDIIARAKWPKELSGLKFFTPQAYFADNGIILAAKVEAARVPLLVTVTGRVGLSEQGLLELDVDSIYVGAVNITPVARLLAGKMYKSWRESSRPVNDDLLAQILASLLEDKPFEPILNVQGHKVKPEKVTLTRGRLALQFGPSG